MDCQDRIRADGPEGGGHPDDQEAEIAIAEIDVRPEQVDRAVGGGNGKGQVPVRAPKTDGGLIDNRPALGAELDGPAARVRQVEIAGRAAAVDYVMADADKD